MAAGGAYLNVLRDIRGGKSTNLHIISTLFFGHAVHAFQLFVVTVIRIFLTTLGPFLALFPDLLPHFLYETRTFFSAGQCRTPRT